MHLYQRQIFGTKKGGFNTEIGGVSATLNTASALASVLGISASNILDFTITGSNIKCNITVNYVIPASAFENNAVISFYKDSGKVTNIGNSAFRTCSLLYYLEFALITSITGVYFLRNESTGLHDLTVICPKLTSLSNAGLYLHNRYKLTLYAPLLTAIGSSTADNFVFYRSEYISGLRLYVNPSLATSNSGAEEGDIAYYRNTCNAQISYVANFTVPSPITDLSSGTIYSTAIQLNFSVPSSTNAIDYYEVYLNGVFVNTITASGSYLKGLQASTSYEIKLVAVDIYYNKSAVSNTLNVSTNTTSAVPTSGLISYYKLENSNDSFGSNNLTSTNTTYSTGKVGNGGVFNATAYLTGAPLLSYGSFTICAWIKTTNTGETFIFSNRSTSSGNPIIAMEVYSNKLFTRIRSSAGTGITSFSSLSNVNTGNWIHVAMRFDISTGLQSNFINGVLENSVSYTGGTFGGFNVGTIGVEAAASPSYGKFNGNIDEVAVYNVSLTNLQLELIYNNGNGTTL